MRKHLLSGKQVINHATSLQVPHMCVHCREGVTIALFFTLENINTPTSRTVLEVIELSLIRPIILHLSFTSDRNDEKNAATHKPSFSADTLSSSEVEVIVTLLHAD